jgi:DNA-binding NarL/FixJ family response regulator
MLHIILATCRPDAMSSFSQALSSNPEVHLACLASGAEVLDAVRTSPPHLVVVDSALQDAKPLDLVSRLLQVNAMVNTAVLSPLSEDAFHEATEGLGILGRIPESPGSGDAVELLRKLKQVLGMTV